MKAPRLNIKEWINAPDTTTLERYRGKVVLITAFQMLCPGCVNHTIPQAKNVYETFHSSKVAVIGLHSVFEHHEAMKPVSLRAFVHEYNIKFPVAIDMPSKKSPLPNTMKAYMMQGTPTTILINHEGYITRQVFGHLPDLVLGAEIMSLIKVAENSINTDKVDSISQSKESLSNQRCSNEGSV